MDQGKNGLGIGAHLILSLSAGIIFLSAAPVMAQKTLDPTAPIPSRKSLYEDCLKTADRRPEQGFEDALAWKGEGGGTAADHCAAVSLFNLGQFENAARRLEALGHTALVEPELKAGLFAQAGQAWLLARKPDRATKALSAADTLMPAQPDVLIDRAQAWAARGDYKAAELDLTAAITVDPKRPDAFALRAAARRFLNQEANAFSDANTALRLDPDHPEARLERGILHRLSGQNDAARKDWLHVLRTRPETQAAEIARDNLERLDLMPDGIETQPTVPRR